MLFQVSKTDEGVSRYFEFSQNLQQRLTQVCFSERYYRDSFSFPALTDNNQSFRKKEQLKSY